MGRLAVVGELVDAEHELHRVGRGLLDQLDQLVVDKEGHMVGRPLGRVDEDALTSLDPDAIKTRPRLMAALATAHVQQGNIDEACRIGSDALELADRQQVSTNIQDFRRLRLDLQPWHDARVVRELDAQLTAVSRTTGSGH